jgi:hypothetical protein
MLGALGVAFTGAAWVGWNDAMASGVEVHGWAGACITATIGSAAAAAGPQATAGSALVRRALEVGRAKVAAGLESEATACAEVVGGTAARSAGSASSAGLAVAVGATDRIHACARAALVACRTRGAVGQQLEAPPSAEVVTGGVARAACASEACLAVAVGAAHVRCAGAGTALVRGGTTLSCAFEGEALPSTGVVLFETRAAGSTIAYGAVAVVAANSLCTNASVALVVGATTNSARPERHAVACF